MGDQVLETNAGRGYRNGAAHGEPDAHAILDGSQGNDHSLEQVREILFGAESRRSEAERCALEAKVAERFDKIEAEYERRFERLLQDLHQRFDRSCAMLEAESAERREAMRIQHDKLIMQLETAADSLGQTKTGREELADLLNDLANRLRAATAA
jgi:NTP pyrophosphatase (non-canonical NTP hydrolase)